MKPIVPAVASAIAERLRTEIVPVLTGFRANNMGMAAAMLDMIAEEWDRAASRLVEENRAIRGILAHAAEVLEAPALGLAAAGTDEDLRISALQAANDQLRAALIDAQTQAEDRADAPARALDALIWAELRRSVDRRRISSANF